MDIHGIFLRLVLVGHQQFDRFLEIIGRRSAGRRRTIEFDILTDELEVGHQFLLIHHMGNPALHHTVADDLALHIGCQQGGVICSPEIQAQKDRISWHRLLHHVDLILEMFVLIPQFCQLLFNTTEVSLFVTAQEGYNH